MSLSLLTEYSSSQLVIEENSHKDKRCCTQNKNILLYNWAEIGILLLLLYIKNNLCKKTMLRMLQFK